MEDLKVFKIGGKVVDDPVSLQAFVQDFASVKGKKLLVHGGGKSVTEMSRRLGIEVKMIQGRRITDGSTLEVVKMMLAGVANAATAFGQAYAFDKQLGTAQAGEITKVT